MNYNLDRFINAQERDYELALLEMKNGKKRSHWMWYIFPQLKMLGKSANAQFYGIDGKEEAIEFLNNEYLRKHLIEISETLYLIDNDISKILEYPDNLKLNSCMTLFEYADPSIEIFGKIIDKFFNGNRDQITLKLLDKIGE